MPGGRDRIRALILAALAATMCAVAIASIRFGAIDFSLREMGTATFMLVTGREPATLDGRIFTQLRLPRAVMCLLVGACLGVGGTLMQALFRNPIVEPGLVGTSSGAAFGASLFFALGGVLNFATGPWMLSRIWLSGCSHGMFEPAA